MFSIENHRKTNQTWNGLNLSMSEVAPPYAPESINVCFKANLNEIIEDSNRIQAGTEFGQARVLFS